MQYFNKYKSYKRVILNAISISTTGRINACKLWTQNFFNLLLSTHHYLAPLVYRIIGFIRFARTPKLLFKCAETHCEMSVQEEPRDYYVWSKLWTKQNFARGNWHTQRTEPIYAEDDVSQEHNIIDDYM